ncbi:MAG TPA: GNAT family N-acetyltransferase [Pyrinomonadaceae bacterium]|nr:GNAT family N-acetyltransferase [Pyrinomonadaceae bacterium]
MEIETERLLMRMYRPEDADEQLRIISTPQFRTHFPESFQPTRDKVLVGIGRILEHWNLRGHGQWALELKGEGRMCGYCGLRYLVPTDEVELLYGIDDNYRRRGLTTEAARAALRFGFEERGFERVMAVTVHENTGSRRVMEKSGLRYERDDRYFDIDCVYYAINREEFRPDTSAHYAVKRSD